MNRAKTNLILVFATVVLGSGLFGLGVAEADNQKPLEGRGAFSENIVTPVGNRSSRVWGENRYETAVAISQQVWGPENTLVVFLATGTGFADALAMGASTMGDGPILLTEPNVLTQVTANELARLQPCGVVILGGPDVVSDAVAAAADAFTIECPSE